MIESGRSEEESNVCSVFITHQTQYPIPHSDYKRFYHPHFMVRETEVKGIEKWPHSGTT